MNINERDEHIAWLERERVAREASAEHARMSQDERHRADRAHQDAWLARIVAAQEANIARWTEAQRAMIDETQRELRRVLDSLPALKLLTRLADANERIAAKLEQMVLMSVTQTVTKMEP